VFCEQQPDARWVRFCFAKQEATLEEAADRLCRI
jgi:methionine aminotransferase